MIYDLKIYLKSGLAFILNKFLNHKNHLVYNSFVIFDHKQIFFIQKYALCDLLKRVNYTNSIGFDFKKKTFIIKV